MASLACSVFRYCSDRVQKPCFTPGLSKLVANLAVYSKWRGRALDRSVVVSVAVPALDMECVAVSDWWDVVPYKMG